MDTYKFYAIKKGFKTGLFFGLWNEIEPYVKGYTGAIYKSFNDKNLANTNSTFSKKVEQIRINNY